MKLFNSAYFFTEKYTRLFRFCKTMTRYNLFFLLPPSVYSEHLKELPDILTEAGGNCSDILFITSLLTSTSSFFAIAQEKSSKMTMFFNFFRVEKIFSKSVNF